MSAAESNYLPISAMMSKSEQPTSTPTVPVLGESVQERSTESKSKSVEDSNTEQDGEGTTAGNRGLFGFGKKMKEDKTKVKKTGEPVPALVSSGPSTTIAQYNTRGVPDITSSPPQSNIPYQAPSSPQRNMYSSSPRISSPDGSQIFERDVQESTIPASPAIPSHIQTENHIPPVLDASSEAITNKEIDPDTVEIVMHSSHQPAAVTVTGVGNTDTTGTWADELITYPDRDDSASSYGVLDSTDIRRLSFISFSDIVQSEHAEHAGHAGTRDSVYVAGLSSLASGHNRSPSPMRSPVLSPQIGTSSPTSHPASIKGVEMSPRAKAVGLSAHPPHSSSELTVETMSQALRRTGSGDLSGFRSQSLNPSSPDGLSDQSFH